MTVEAIRKKIWLNSASNYLRIILRLLLGLFMFRMLYQGLSKEEFGFWALLWSIFGYGILMDFGFGLAAQKSVAALSAHEEWDKLSRVLSTIFFFYFFSAAVIILAVFLSSNWLIDLFQVTAANRETFREILVIYLCFIGLSFPLGIFPEILYGQQRIALANNLASASLVVNFLLLIAALHYGWGLKVIVIIALLCMLVPNLVGGVMGMRAMPGVRLHPRLFSWGMVRETLRFSLFAYICIITNVILASTDRLVISTILAVSAVAIYQAGAKVSEIFTAFTRQLPDTISPAAAHLHAKGDRSALQNLLVDGTRFNVMIATPLYLMCAFYMDGLLGLLTGDWRLPREVFWTGQVLLLWGYSGIITHSISKTIFMMTGQERRLTVVSVVEAVANLALSVALILKFKNVISVAVGSLIPTVIVGWFYLWPWVSRYTKVPVWSLARKVLWGNWRACLPLVGFATLCVTVPALDFRGSLPVFFGEGTVAALIAAAGIWRWGLSQSERDKVSGKMASLAGRFKKGASA